MCLLLIKFLHYNLRDQGLIPNGDQRFASPMGGEMGLGGRVQMQRQGLWTPNLPQSLIQFVFKFIVKVEKSYILFLLFLSNPGSIFPLSAISLSTSKSSHIRFASSSFPSTFITTFVIFCFGAVFYFRIIFFWSNYLQEDPTTPKFASP